MNNLKLENSSYLRSVMIGTLLGNANLQTFTKGSTWRVRFIQGEAHKSYLFHLYDLFKDYVKTPPKLTISNGNERWYFNTIVHSDFNLYANLLYKHKSSNCFIKIIPKEIITDFNDISLAYWFMDNGCLKFNKKAYILCTDIYTLEELKWMREVFKTKWGIWITFHKQRNKYRIYVPVKHYVQMKEIIEPYIIESMEYKL